MAQSPNPTTHTHIRTYPPEQAWPSAAGRAPRLTHTGGRGRPVQGWHHQVDGEEGAQGELGNVGVGSKVAEHAMHGASSHGERLHASTIR